MRICPAPVRACYDEQACQLLPCLLSLPRTIWRISLRLFGGADIWIFRCTRSPRSNSRAGTMFHCRHGGKRKAPGRLSPGPAVPLLTRGLIRDRHAKHAHRIGHFWAWRLQGVHICSLLSHRYSQARAAACISNPHSVSRRRAHAGDGTRSLLISIRQEQTERSQDRSPNRANQRR